VSSELLYYSYEVGVLTRKVELLSKAIAKRRIEAIAKHRDLINVWPVLTTSFIENTFKFSYIYVKRVGTLLKSV
jgi:hypothetical protein